MKSMNTRSVGGSIPIRRCKSTMRLAAPLLAAVALCGCDASGEDPAAASADSPLATSIPYLAAIDGASPTWPSSLTVGHNGQWAAIAFRRRPEGRTDIQIVDLATHTLTRLEWPARNARLKSVRGGDWLAIIGEEEGSNGACFDMQAMQLIDLDDLPPTSGGRLEVSRPDGSKLVYQPFGGGSHVIAGGAADWLYEDIFVVDLRTDNRWRISARDHGLHSAVFSICKDRLILGGHTRDNRSVIQIWELSEDGLDHRQLAELSRWGSDLLIAPPSIRDEMFAYRSSRQAWTVADPADGAGVFDIEVPPAVQGPGPGFLRFVSDEGYGRATGRLLFAPLGPDGGEEFASSILSCDSRSGNDLLRLDCDPAIHPTLAKAANIDGTWIALCPSWRESAPEQFRIMPVRIADLKPGQAFDCPYGILEVVGAKLIVATKSGFEVVELKEALDDLVQ